ncbi:Cro/Cl family transcriptional regulator [Marinobacterium nitratireducens]|uniref:Cro/Cl family transcriptional regulator n=1 Tax=Marinobacterium nitratireducens TaxID=518897 RepID=A0A917ZLC4_9GAMM|nr:helix-turn-helix domain-containing protein [Marinobacterium nitratireducens]GGO85974.1 Cro/Cl family transcriptional regulator [Marinobacterium nitratireducens]
MTQEPTSELDSQISGFPGKSLVRAREQLGMSSAQVASELRLSVQQVDAIEAADFSKLPNVVFTRGYIRAYARLVKLDGDELVRQYDQHVGGERQTAPIRTVTRIRPSGSSGPVTFGSLLLLVLVVVGATFWWWQTQYGHDVSAEVSPEPMVAVDTADGETLVFNSAEMEQPQVSEPLLAESVQATGVASAAQVAVTGEAPVGLTEGAATAVDEAQATEAEPAVTQAATAEQTPQPEQTTQPEQGPSESVIATSEGLYLRFSDDCWVTIKDASGKTLFNNLRKAGQELHLKQNGPLNVLLGRVSAISEFTFDGATVDLAPFSNKNVARLRVPVAQ